MPEGIGYGPDVAPQQGQPQKGTLSRPTAKVRSRPLNDDQRRKDQERTTLFREMIAPGFDRHDFEVMVDKLDPAVPRAFLDMIWQQAGGFGVPEYPIGGS